MAGAFDEQAFTCSDGLANGLTPGVLRGPTYDKPLRGVRTSGPTDVILRLYAAALVVPEGGALTGWSALVVRGVPLTWIDGLDRRMQPLPVRIEAPPGRQPRRRDALDVIRRDGPLDATVIAGIPVVSAPVAWLAEIGRRRDRVLALVLTDAVLRFGLATEAELRQFLESCRGRRGVRLARWALTLTDPWSESPKESEYRLVWIDTGLGRPKANCVVLDENGRFVARTDLYDEVAGVAGEFNGSWHRAGLQPWSDETRIRGVRGLGLEVAVAGEPDLKNAGAGARRLLFQTYALAARRPPKSRRWRIGPRPPLPGPAPFPPPIHQPPPPTVTFLSPRAPRDDKNVTLGGEG